MSLSGTEYTYDNNNSNSNNNNNNTLYADTKKQMAWANLLYWEFAL
jgi:hypothetical protein